MDAAEYKHLVLGLIFLKYISDAFQERYDVLRAEPHADPEDRDEYLAEGVFWVPKEARWVHLQAQAKQPTIGKLIDDGRAAVEKDNPSLKGAPPNDYAKPSLDKQRLGESWSARSAWATGRARKGGRNSIIRICQVVLSNCVPFLLAPKWRPRRRGATGDSRHDSVSAADRNGSHATPPGGGTP
jgi:HsdM N-terminal domain